MITGKLYDYLKWIAQIFLPALGTLYFGLAGIWGLESGEEVVGTIMVLDLFLGTLLGISQMNYNKTVEHGGDLIVDKDGKILFQLDEDKTDMETLADKKEVRYKVRKVDKVEAAA
jgi:hypothetical protein